MPTQRSSPGKGLADDLDFNPVHLCCCKMFFFFEELGHGADGKHSWFLAV
jgi:hypothetical protein